MGEHKNMEQKQIKHTIQINKQREQTMASYLYAPSNNNMQHIQNNEEVEDVETEDMKSKRSKIKKSEQQFYSRLDKMLNQHHLAFLRNLEKKMDQKLDQNQEIMNQKLISFEQQQKIYETEMFETISCNSRAVESLTNKCN